MCVVKEPRGGTAGIKKWQAGTLAVGKGLHRRKEMERVKKN